uniref:Uncharacterized protein n=1 Tax=Mus spicilegus TaxID=10103 RepID=A0A8C6H5Q8_MUSSI
MDVAKSPELDPHSPEDEEQPALSDDDILRESGSEQDLNGAGERASDLEEEENATRPIQVQVLLLVPIPVSHTFPTQTSSQNQGGADPTFRQSRGEVNKEASRSPSPTTGHQKYCSWS